MARQPEPDSTGAVEVLREAVTNFGSFIRELPDEALVEKACGPREMLIHLVFWLESYVTQVAAILAGETPVLPHGRFDDLNAQAVAANRGVPVAELLRRHQAACQWLGEAAQRHDPDRIILTLKKGSAFKHPLIRYLSAEARHIRWHQAILERQLTRQYLDDVDGLRDTVAAFSRFIRQLPETALVEQDWSLKEALAYLVFWHERCLAQIKGLLAEDPAPVSTDRLKDLQAQAIAESRGVSVSELLDRFEGADERLRSFGRTLDPQTIVIAVRGHRQTLDGAILTLTGHIRRQQQKLARAMQPRRETNDEYSGGNPG